MRFAFIDNVLIERTEQGVEVELQPHLGLIALIAGLRAAGHEGVLYDPKIALARRELEAAPGFAAAVAERIAALEADAVGFTTLGSNFATTIRIAQALRPLRPALPIVLGGPHATILDREILERYPAFDAIVRGEADETIGAFAAALGGEGSLDDVPGVSYRAGGTVRRSPDAAAVADLDALPFAAYEAYPIAELGLGILAVDAGRGCPFHCSFCSTATFFGRRYRLKSAARLVCELDRLCAAYGVRRFVLNHDLFTVNKKKIREFCAAVAGRGYRWSCSARLDCVDDALLADMAAAGCTGIYYGIETGSARLQRVVEKNLDLALYHPRIGRSLELGMAVTASFITGYPQETREDQDRTLALLGETLERYDERLSPQLHLLAPEPGTALHARFAETLAYDGYRIDFVSPAIEHGDRELAASDPLTFVCHHYYAAGLARATHLAVVEGFTNLLQLPRVVLRELVRAYGPFADLVRDAGAFLSASVRLPPTQALAAFVDAALGPDRPVTDAVRYLAAVAELRPAGSPATLGTSPYEPIALAACVRPLGAIREPAAVLRCFERGEPAGELPRRHRLLVGTRDGSAHATFEIDAATSELACRLARPATPAELGALGDDAVRLRLCTLGLIGALSTDVPARVEERQVASAR